MRPELEKIVSELTLAEKEELSTLLAYRSSRSSQVTYSSSEEQFWKALNRVLAENNCTFYSEDLASFLTNNTMYVTGGTKYSRDLYRKHVKSYNAIIDTGYSMTRYSTNTYMYISPSELYTMYFKLIEPAIKYIQYSLQELPSINTVLTMTNISIRTSIEYAYPGYIAGRNLGLLLNHVVTSDD